MAIAEAEVQPEAEERTIYPGMPITEGELMRLPRDGRKWEMEDGRLTEVPTQFGHDEIGFNIILLIGPHTRGRGVGTTGQDGFRMANGNVRAPDVSFTRTERIPGGRPNSGFGSVAPDLCVEIISPSERLSDIASKLRDYFDSGASLVWHVFPETRSVRVWTSPTEARALNAEDVLDAGSLLPGFSCRVSQLFNLE